MEGQEELNRVVMNQLDSIEELYNIHLDVRDMSARYLSALLNVRVDKENLLEFPLDYSLLRYKQIYLLIFVHIHAHCISIKLFCLMLGLVLFLSQTSFRHISMDNGSFLTI